MGADVAVIGAGVVGVATARELARSGARVTLLERHADVGREQSSHNSQVVHSGIFLTPGSQRARFALEGHALLFELAPRWGVPIDASGTLIVAQHANDMPRLEQFAAWGEANGVEGTRRLSEAEAHAIEPHLGPCERALWSPHGGRIDAAALVRALADECEREGVELVPSFEVTGAERSARGWSLRSKSGELGPFPRVVNSAGIGSGRVAGLLGAPGHDVYPCLGEYAVVRGPKREWVRSMVYGFPPPGYPGIGVHLTRLLSGELLLGPTATYLNAPTAPADPVTPLSVFLAESAPLLPGLALEDLAPWPPGIRAKRLPPGSADSFADFAIVEEPASAGVVHLIGIESPGLTSCLSLAREVTRRCGRRPPSRPGP
jgi:glycerol-3-phosphate dehydrogenase